MTTMSTGARVSLKPVTEIKQVGKLVIRPGERRFKDDEIKLADVFRPSREITEGCGVRVGHVTSEFAVLLRPKNALFRVAQEISLKPRGFVTISFEAQYTEQQLLDWVGKKGLLQFADLLEFIARPASELCELMEVSHRQVNFAFVSEAGRTRTVEMRFHGDKIDFTVTSKRRFGYGGISSDRLIMLSPETAATALEDGA
jgi:hypothetical protein